METTCINLVAVTIVGNLALLCAIPVAGIIWFVLGGYIKGRG